MLHKFLCGLSLLIAVSTTAQAPYQFTTGVDIEASPVISQGRTGTCWSFSSTSFLESEIRRITGMQIDLSEMYQVRNTYTKKAENYVMRQGKAQFGQGGLAHDVIHAAAANGLVPASVYDGLQPGDSYYNHTELASVLTSMLKTYVSNPAGELSPKWLKAVNAVLDIYMGPKVEQFTYNGTDYTPKSFMEMTGIVPANYVSITSFTQAPFYTSFILNVPDNWSNGSFYNVPLDEMMAVIDHAIKNGYTVVLDCDVSEPTFSARAGVAVIPEDAANNEKALEGIYPEKEIDQEYRQKEFENYETTDDHLMHITGILKDQNGTKYYKVKNSWGTNPERTSHGGYVYFSEPYMRLKTISVMVHKDALPKTTAKKLVL